MQILGAADLETGFLGGEVNLGAVEVDDVAVAVSHGGLVDSGAAHDGVGVGGRLLPGADG